MIREIREKSIREGLVLRCGEVLKETKNKVRVGGKIGEKFWIGREVRQGYPLSLHLFNILLADLEEEMRKERWEGVKVTSGKIFTLAYVDDVVLTEKEEDMRTMVYKIEKYLKRKG